MILKFIIILIILIVIYYLIKNLKLNTFIDLLINHFNLKINVKGIDNLKYISNKKIVIMSNHTNPIDFFIIYSIFNKAIDKKIFTIVKHNVIGDPNDKNKVSVLLSIFRKKLYNFLQFVSYTRNNKDSGEETKDKILNIINNNNTVILFPEGTVSRLGISKDFKSGSFRLCAENDISIIPITLEYNKRIGMGESDGFNPKDLYNTHATLHIHKPISNTNWEELKQETYDTIVNPIKEKYKRLNIIN